jgi:hypothetical protein
MGIENIARLLGIYSNHSVAILDERCVRLLCEKRCHTSQGQPMPANVTCSAAAVEAKAVVHHRGFAGSIGGPGRSSFAGRNRTWNPTNAVQ